MNVPLHRREFLRRTGMAAALPLLPIEAATPAVPDSEAERLFRLGRFTEADRGFARILRDNPNDAHAAARRGYLALMSNRLSGAERFLTKAIGLDSGDTFAKQLLIDCFVRQDRLSRAVPLLKEIGREPTAKQYAAVTGTPYELHGAQEARIPWLQLDPLPVFEASVGGGKPLRFTFDTGGTILNLTKEVAEQAGLEAVSTIAGQINGRTITMYLGVLDSFRLGGIEVRNLPVLWHEGEIPRKEGDPPTAGVIGRTVFYHFLTTLDYANRALVLRTKSQPVQAGTRLPLWLAAEHYHFTLGTLGNLDPGMALIDTGGAGGMALFTSEEVARRAGVRVDRDRPDTSYGDADLTVYPAFPKNSGLGKAVARDLYGIAGPIFLRDQWVQFETIANFTHGFLKPFTLTYDVVGMNLYISGGR